jgi:multisubunit Na+/H+ antiporter MnhB subunit
VIERAVKFAAVLAGFGSLTWALVSLPEPSPGLAGEVAISLERSGVSNPVTAVLLNFRGYDTFLEVAVLLLAVVGVWSARRAPTVALQVDSDSILTALLRFVVPLLVLTGGYLLWIGSFAPGGAFQGGALLGGTIVLLLLGSTMRQRLGRQRALVRLGLCFGLAVFGAVALAAMLLGGGLLQYPEEQAGLLILAIEAAALVSIGLTLGVLFLAGEPTQNGTQVKGEEP